MIAIIQKLHRATSILQLDFKSQNQSLWHILLKWVLKVSHYKSLNDPKTTKEPQQQPILTQHQHQSGHRIARQKPKSKAVHFIHYIQHKLAANGAGAQKFRWLSSSLLEQALVANKIGQICREKVHVSKQDIELSQLLRG